MVQSLGVGRGACGTRAFKVVLVIKNLLAMQETWVQFLGQEDPLEKGMATHCSILAWRTPWTKKAGGLQSMGLQRVRHNWVNSRGLSCRLLRTSRNESIFDISFNSHRHWHMGRIQNILLNKSVR